MHGDGVNIILKICACNDVTGYTLVRFQVEHATAVAAEPGKLARSIKHLEFVRY